MKRVVITGLGCISPLGNQVDRMWSELIAGHCAIDFIQSLDTTDLPVKVAAEVKDFKPEDYGIDRSMIRHNDRYALYALAAASQAMLDSGLEAGKNVDPTRLGCAVGSGVGGITYWLNSFAVAVQSAFTSTARPVMLLLVSV